MPVESGLRLAGGEDLLESQFRIVHRLEDAFILKRSAKTCEEVETGLHEFWIGWSLLARATSEALNGEETHACRNGFVCDNLLE